MYQENYFCSREDYDALKKKLDNLIELTKATIATWENVSFPTKKDGTPYKNLSKNIKGADLHTEEITDYYYGTRTQYTLSAVAESKDDSITEPLKIEFFPEGEASLLDEIKMHIEIEIAKQRELLESYESYARDFDSIFETVSDLYKVFCRETIVNYDDFLFESFMELFYEYPSDYI